MNHLHYGDNLRVLRESIAGGSVDLIYLDPPFNSNASYNLLFKGPEGTDSQAQIEAFDDTWHWTQSAAQAYAEVLTSGNSDAAEMLRAMRQFLGENDMMAYLAMMAVRLIELHRVLKPTGSLYLHCDPTASHYLKILLDAVFGARRYINEIVWLRANAHNFKTRYWPRQHDTLLLYAKGDTLTLNPQYEPYGQQQLKRYSKDKNGRYFTGQDLTVSLVRPRRQFEWRGVTPPAHRSWGASKEQLETWLAEGRILLRKDGKPRMDGLVKYLDEMKGKQVGTLWTDIDRIKNTADERLGYPTQKPVALLERIISASSNPGDVVLDPFCGCGTTVHAAEKLGRQWIGIDVTHLAIGLIKRRLREAFEGIAFEVHGVPTDLGGARTLAEADKHEFEKWAISLIPNAQPWKQGKKGADRGIDGVLYVDGPDRRTERCLISVKGGASVGVSMIRDLVGTMEREGAPMGLFLTLAEPTRPMLTEAAAAGFWDTDWGQIPRLQIVTVEQLLTSVAPPIRIPMARSDTYRKAAREERPHRQGSLDL
jgi:site-specific DNA-methyltransferase (adenine-specific)